MNPEPRILLEGGNFVFEILDKDDSTEYNGETLYESLHVSEPYAREQTAERNAAKWIKEFNSAGSRKRRKMLGYDPVSQCWPSGKLPPVLRRVGSRRK